jgi:hypothetical protein
MRDRGGPDELVAFVAIQGALQMFEEPLAGAKSSGAWRPGFTLSERLA